MAELKIMSKHDQATPVVVVPFDQTVPAQEAGLAFGKWLRLNVPQAFVDAMQAGLKSTLAEIGDPHTRIVVTREEIAHAEYVEVDGVKLKSRDGDTGFLVPPIKDVLGREVHGRVNSMFNWPLMFSPGRRPRRETVRFDVEAQPDRAKFVAAAAALGITVPAEDDLPADQRAAVEYTKRWFTEKGFTVVREERLGNGEVQLVIDSQQVPEPQRSLMTHGTGPNSRFKRVVQEAIAKANDVALSWGHEYIGTEHLLYGMAMTEAGQKLLTACAIAPEPISAAEVIQARIRDLVKLGPAIATAGKLEATPRAKAVLTQFALKEAGEGQIGLRELLIGLLAEKHGVAGHILEDLGLTAERVRSTRLSPESYNAGVFDEGTDVGNLVILDEVHASPAQIPPGPVNPLGENDADAAKDHVERPAAHDADFGR